MTGTLIILPALALLYGLLHFEKREKPWGIVLLKASLSSLFVLVVLTQPHPIPRYYYFLLTGLVFCWAGDIFLSLTLPGMFLAGLVSFLLGHILYNLGFFYLSGINQWTWAGSFIVLVSSVTAYVWLRPHLGSMKTPVLLYIAVISVMISGASSVMGDINLEKPFRIMTLTGAVAFYLSDIFVARDRFIRAEFLNRLTGLPMYYAGQFLIAFSVGQL